MATKETISSLYKEQYQAEPQLVAVAPGRINIIGEHTDYNDGFVLPAAIAQHTVVAVSKREDQIISLYSVLFKEEFTISLSELKPQKHSWVNYILGVVDQLVKKGCAISGFNMAVDGNVPLGAGLSSSASVECATAVALNQLFQLDLSKQELTQIAQLAEHTYAGVKCGIMDQFASMFGKENHVVRLDCKDLSYQYFPLELGDYALLLLNTNVKHSLASSAYNNRRAACEKAVEIIKAQYPEVTSLRDVTFSMLDELIKEQHPEIYPKAKYVVGEKLRVEGVCEALEAGDLAKVGALMVETHQGLSKDYEVSCNELDFLVDFIQPIPEVLGARVMGGGFGGCTINLVKKDYIDTLIEQIKPAYERKFHLELTPIKVSPAEGARIL